MIMVPLVWLVSVLTGLGALAIALNPRLPVLARVCFSSFMLMLAGAALLLGLRLSYASNWAGLVQPHIAIMIAPLAFLGFWSLTQDSQNVVRFTLARNAALVLLAQGAMLLPLPLSADFILFAIASFYLVRLALLVRLEPDAFVSVAAADFPKTRFALLAALALLALMVAGDAVIVAAVILAPEAYFLAFLSGAAGLMSGFVFVVALIGIPLLISRPQRSGRSDDRAQQPSTQADRDLLDALTRLMEDKHLFTDSNLTLVRVARRLGVTTRELSNAVNRCTGDNFSRVINGFRIRNAQQMLRETDLPVTEIMLSCGFLSKSSFNTEFRRVTGQTPSQFRAQG